MGISGDNVSALVAALGADEWPTALGAVSDADAYLRSAAPGSPEIRAVIDALVLLARHQKWEVRRAVANVAARSTHPQFEGALARFVTDDNALVRQAAQRAALRRRDWQNAGAFGRQHEARINSTLDDVEARFGVRGRAAVKRAAAQIADTFARELYHEVIKLIAPIANSAERLSLRVSDINAPREQLANDASKIGRRVRHLKSVLDAMRTYTAQPNLAFQTDNVTEIVKEALEVVRDGGAGDLLPDLILGSGRPEAKVSRARLVQALTNVLTNAVESYEPGANNQPICVRVEEEDGRVEIVVEDFGCGMNDEVLADATVLFTTSKPNGTGFGLPLTVKIIESEHSGRITLQSAKGRGTVVRITIPKHQHERQ